MSIMVRVEEKGYIELPVRLFLAGTPLDGVVAADLLSGGCVGFYFADGSTEQIHVVDGPAIPVQPVFVPIVAGPSPLGLYHVGIPRRIFTAVRRGPFQYVVTPNAPGAFDVFVGSGSIEDYGQAVWDYQSIRALLDIGGAEMVGTMGTVMRLLKQQFAGRVLIDAATKRRTVFDELGNPITIASTKDQLGAPSTDPIYETVPLADVAPPTVLFVSPSDTEDGVSLDSVVNVGFSEMMNAASLTGILFIKVAGAVPVAHALAIVGRSAILAPSAPLLASTPYRVTVPVTVKDVFGNFLAGAVVTNFTTGPAC